MNNRDPIINTEVLAHDFLFEDSKDGIPDWMRLLDIRQPIEPGMTTCGLLATLPDLPVHLPGSHALSK